VTAQRLRDTPHVFQPGFAGAVDLCAWPSCGAAADEPPHVSADALPRVAGPEYSGPVRPGVADVVAVYRSGDPLERIAAALERIADRIAEWEL
jgi:hypothetical protein